MSILDAFHFDLSASQLNVKLVPAVTTEVSEEQKREPGRCHVKTELHPKKTCFLHIM